MTTTTWSISIKTVGKSRFHRASHSDSTNANIRVDDDDDDDDIKPSNCIAITSNSNLPDVDDHGTLQSRSRDERQEQQHQHDDGRHHHANNHSDASETNFTIVVHPDDPLHSLHEKIEHVTGLKAEEQRLIYRGRIINCCNQSSNSGGNSQDSDHISLPPPSLSSSSSSTTTTNNNTFSTTEPCVKDVCGLCDKQTIHLVPRINIPNNNSNNNTNATNTANGASQRNSTNSTSSFVPSDELGELGDRLFGTNEGEGGSSIASLSGEAGLSLLAALLGMPSSSSSTSGVGLSAGGGNDSASAEGDTARVGVGNGSHSENSGVGEGRVGTGDGTTVVGMGGLGELFRGMGIPMEGVDTGGRLFGFPPSSGDTNDAMGDQSAGTNVMNSRIRRGTRAERTNTIPPFAASTRRVRRNALPPSSTLSSSLAAARATAARLTEADIQTPDPGRLEPVRQGLLTLHTLLGNALPSLDHRQMMMTTTIESLAALGVGAEQGELTLQQSSDEFSVRSPLDSRRQWYRGQWLDVLDTVNQWLEATVVDIALPSDVLPDLIHAEDDARRENRSTNNGWRMTRRSPPDAVVSANDLEGRRRLLLELVPRNNHDDDDNESECEESDHNDLPRHSRRRTLNYLPSPDEGYYYIPRAENNTVQLLLIHYNGWPHRWDEWIRSDSERIRPFRTRTRHRVTPSLAAGTAYGNGTASSFFACPTPQAIFSASPSTAIWDEEDMISERSGMLFELSRVVQGVNEVLATAAHRTSSGRSGSNNLPTESSHLPWSTNLNSSGEILNRHEEWAATGLGSPSSIIHRTQVVSAQLRQLAPLVDRLGRILTDAAPHIAALADSLSHQPNIPSSNTRTGIDATSRNVLTLRSDLSNASPSQSTTFEEADHSQLLAARASHLYFGIGDDNTEENTGLDTLSRVRGQEVVHEETTSIIDPDLTDYINGMVNTTRYLGGTGSSRNSNRENSIVDQSGSSLLASYLASMGGSAGNGSSDSNRVDAGTHPIGNDNPRVIRMGGGNGGNRGSGFGGLDIHIHAIVTGPGMGGFGGLGGFPFDNFGGGGATPTSPPTNSHNHVFGSAATATASPTENNEDADLFSELYSEWPNPINLHREDNNSHGERIGNDAFDGSALGQTFEDCLSIDEENSSDDTNVGIVRVADTEIIESEKTANDVFFDSNDESVNGSILALSEIESQGSTTSFQHESGSTSSINSMVPTQSASFPLLQVEGVRYNLEAPVPHRSLPSLRNRLFRRTIGRLSLMSRRSSEQRSRSG